MQPTTIGPNLTAATLSPAALQAMNKAADELTPFQDIDTSAMESHKRLYIGESDAVGSIPPASAAPATVGKTGQALGVFMDKLGERLAYERSGVRLYDALILKYRSALDMDPAALPPASPSGSDDGEPAGGGQDAAATLERIRSDELGHFQMLSSAIQALGGDPTATTPCADVTAVASSGFMQVLNDPRTTLAQCLNAMLTVELADNAGWELLAGLADEAGHSELAGQFLGALAQEQEHLRIVRQWVATLLVEEPQSAVA